ncbi:Mpp6p [Saccharomyces paradoxus]|uniref:Mpp6p n=1 Tax=Saccharomyces paradoxus TaxID=27291 RepID=A0A8B8UZ16_SACPA|nr:Mpp6 [Saccharomyces paradoxus]QHS75924.1 Mpp6 [Saccharomyces paradoxus]
MSTNNGVTGKLSSRVMNMKFMKFGKTDDEESSNSNTPSIINSDVESNEQREKLFGRDNSAWDLNSYNDDVKKISGKQKKKMRKVVYKKRPHLIISNVGYSELRKPEGVMNGRKVFGDNPNDIGSRKRKLEESEQNEEGKSDAKDKEFTGSQEEGEDEYDLDKLFKDSIKKKKTTHNTKNKNGNSKQ